MPVSCLPPFRLQPFNKLHLRRIIPGPLNSDMIVPMTERFKQSLPNLWLVSLRALGHVLVGNFHKASSLICSSASATRQHIKCPCSSSLRDRPPNFAPSTSTGPVWPFNQQA